MSLWDYIHKDPGGRRVCDTGWSRTAVPGKQGCYDVRPSFKSLGFPFEKLYLLVSQWEETRDCLKGGPTCALKR